MGCDYYIVTALEVFYENTKDFFVIEKEKGYYIEVDGEENMTEEEYDNCEEKYGSNFIEKTKEIYSNGKWVDDIDEINLSFSIEGQILNVSQYHSSRSKEINLNEVKKIVLHQYFEDRY